MNCRFRYLAATVALLATYGFGYSSAAAVELSIAHPSPLNSHEQAQSEEFQRLVRAKSGGALDIKIFPNAQLGGEKDIVEGILLGSIDFGKPSVAVLANWAPEFNILNMPFLFRDLGHLIRATDPSGVIFAKLSKAAAAKRIRLLAVTVCCSRNFMSKRPINSISDLKGMKIRAIQNPVHVAAFNAFGANATAIAFSEVYGALQTGVVDAAENGNQTYYFSKFYEQAPYLAQVEWLILAEALIMSESKFQSYSPAQQKMLLEAGAEVAQFSMRFASERETESLEKLKATPAKITHPDRAPFIAASRKVYDEFLKKDDEKELLKLIQDVK